MTLRLSDDATRLSTGGFPWVSGLAMMGRMSRRDTRSDDAHDVLAADEFAMPASDPELHARAEPAHDVLAADEYGMPGADPDLHHRHVALPPDPAGLAEPHDVLAAEAYAMPAPRSGEPGMRLAQRPDAGSRIVLEAGVLLVALLLVRRLLRRD
jgi:hypothetical protein